MPKKRQKAPKAGLTYSVFPDAVTNGKQLFWDLMVELMRDKGLSTVDIPDTRLNLGTYQERVRPSLNPESIVSRMMESGVSQERLSRRLFSPTVGMLAGVAWQNTGVLPDAAQLALYRDGDDWVAPHIDYEGLFGPEPDDVVVAIFSFGATRRFGFLPIGSSLKEVEAAQDKPPVIEPLPDSSLLVMKGELQRKWLHTVLREPGLEAPRISVSFVSYQRRPKAASHMLVEKRDGDQLRGSPRYVGTPEQCTRVWCEIIKAEGVHRSQLTDVPQELWPPIVDGPDLAIAGPDSSCSSVMRAVTKYTGLKPEAPPGVDVEAFKAHMTARYGENYQSMYPRGFDG